MTREERENAIRCLKLWIEREPQLQTYRTCLEALSTEPCREADDYENEIADLHDRLDIAEYDKERLREEVTVLEEKLKSLSAEPCDDCISRQAVLEIFGYVMDYWKEHAIDVEPHEIKDALIEQYEFTAKQLSDLLPVTPKQKMGHWYIDERPESNRETICSVCEHAIFDYHILEFDWRPKYCPNCGAKMEESEGET